MRQARESIRTFETTKSTHKKADGRGVKASPVFLPDVGEEMEDLKMIKATLPKNYKELFTLAEVETARKIIRDLKGWDDTTCEKWVS